jgi:type IV pilus assembly protein PilE
MRHSPSVAASQRGFTLIELMIVVAVVAILAVVAYPSFQESIRKSRRADALAGLMRLQQAQERYRANQPAYAATAASMPGAGTESPERHYNLSIDAAAPTSYTMSATAKSSSPQYADIKCRRITVAMNNGTLSTTSFDANNVEDTTNSNRCWVR